MRTISRTVGKTESGGEPLSPVFRAFAAEKILLRRSEVSMFAGAPGVGKSTLALAVALRTNVPTLYICADTGAHTMSMRLYSMITGVSQIDAERILASDEDKARTELNKAGHIKWSFEAAPNLSDIDEEVLAFEEVHGENPHLIVIDNLSDITEGGGEEWSGMRATMKEIKYLARDTNAAILLLHHTSEAFIPSQDGVQPICPPRYMIQGKVSQLPAMICTLGMTPSGDLAVAPVKNRYGKAVANGTEAVFLDFNPAFMYLADIKETA
jgi:KaiC/GvpD/RAD55 family RecA-like ATPase